MYRFINPTLPALVVLAVLLAGSPRATAQEPDAAFGLDFLEKGMEVAAEVASRSAFTKIELTERGDLQVEKRSPTHFEAAATYYIYTRGTLIGRDRFLLTVRVRGRVTYSDGNWLRTILGSTVVSRQKLN